MHLRKLVVVAGVDAAEQLGEESLVDVALVVVDRAAGGAVEVLVLPVDVVAAVDELDQRAAEDLARHLAGTVDEELRTARQVDDLVA
ncbi:hypothetical protein LOC64_14420 [Rubrivivax sp. JA1029]|uniref:hypothetical protein n=1 Tax=Rubrivivax sp. JA1029 TaxID=2894193 RepID=UPI001E3D7E91|nr:hypothetical protein [Rubrivivax sp. JA1029]MCC9648198.1 hypothetical protein [Rubrivivax sp. JA1029]